MRQKTNHAVMATSALGLAMLLGSVTATAEVIFDSVDTVRALGITNLDIGGTLYDVDFGEEDTTALTVYDEFPGTYDFPGVILAPPDDPKNSGPEAKAAVDAVNDALQAAGAMFVSGIERPGGVTDCPDALYPGCTFRVGFNGFIVPIGDVDTVAVWEGAVQGATWARPEDWDQLSYNFDERIYATYTVVPEPSGALLLGTAVAVVGLVRIRRRD